MEPKIKYTVGPDVDLRKTIIRDKNGKRITNRRAEKMAKQAIAEVLRRQELGDETVKSPKRELRLRSKFGTHPSSLAHHPWRRLCLIVPLAPKLLFWETEP